MGRASLHGLKEAREDSDAVLFETIARGDLGPLGVLFDRYHEDVRQFLLRASPNAADVNDLTQETFLAASRAATAYDGRESARPFLLGIAAQLVRRRRRTFARLRKLVEAFGVAPAPSPRTPEESASLGEEADRVRSAVARLSDDRRLVLVMVEWNGMSGPEVASALDIPVGTVWRRLHEARAALRVALERGTR